MRTRLRSDQAATDPILVIAAIAVSLVLLVGGSFAVGGMRANASELNAKKDLGNIVTAETGWLTAAETYTSDLAALATGVSGGIGFTSTPGSTAGIVTGTNCYAAFTTSTTGTVYWAGSSMTVPTKVDSPWPATAPGKWPAGCAWPASNPSSNTGAATVAASAPATPFASMVSTLAGGGSSGSVDGTGTAAKFSYPYGVVVAPDGNGYVTDQNAIRRITPAGVVTTFAGSGTSGSVDGTGTAARFYIPKGITSDAAGNLYVGDWNYKLRKITPAGVVTSIAGAGTNSFADGVGTSAKFGSLNALAATPDGTKIYASDSSNNRIRLFTISGGTVTVSTVAGTGTASNVDGGLGTSTVNQPYGMALTPDGSKLYFNSGPTIRVLNTTTNFVTTVAGDGTSALVNGPALGGAEFVAPIGLALDTNGDIYVTDSVISKPVIRKISNGQVTTVAGGNLGNAGDGPALSAGLNLPEHLSFDTTGRLWIAENSSHSVGQLTTR